MIDTTENIPKAYSKLDALGDPYSNRDIILGEIFHCLHCGNKITLQNKWLNIRMLCRRCYHLLEVKESLRIYYLKNGMEVRESIQKSVAPGSD